MPVGRALGEAPQIRITLKPSITLEEAEKIQTDIAAVRLNAETAMPAPFRLIDVRVREQDISSVEQKLRKELRTNGIVQSVVRCPCTPPEPPANRSMVGPYLAQLKRTCSGMVTPLRASGCATQFQRITPVPVYGCYQKATTEEEFNRNEPCNTVADAYPFIFEAVVYPPRSGGVRKVTGKFFPDKSAGFAGDFEPAGDLIVTPLKRTFPLKIFGYTHGVTDYQTTAVFTPGRVQARFTDSHSFEVSSRPDKPAASPVRIKGLVTPFVPAGTKLDWRYEVETRFFHPAKTSPK